MTKKYDILVFVGRFQPLHNAHLEIINRATALTDHLVIITGSANQPRTYKNPFSSHERGRMIKCAAGGLSMAINVETNIDTIYNDQAWGSRIQDIVSKYATKGSKVGIIGHKKDDSTRYLDMFPQWELEEVGLIEPLNATDVRDLYFRKDVNMNFIKSVVPTSTFDFLIKFKNTSEYEQILREREFVANYKKQFSSLPYPPVFVTTDTVVVCSGHVLMIKRRAEPGKNLMALPGGYFNADTDKSILDAAIRELQEETKIKIPNPVLRGSIVNQHVFDAIDRDPRGRVITHAYYIKLSDGVLPKVKGSDDAISAKWIPLSEISSENCYSDHFEIIKVLVGL